MFVTTRHSACSLTPVVTCGLGRHYTSSFATGLSGHGLLTNGLAVLQDVGGPNPRFGVGGFMLLVAVVQLAALAAFDTLRRRRSSVAASRTQRGKGWGRTGRMKPTGDELLDGEKEGLTDGEEGREADDEVGGLSSAKETQLNGRSANTFKFLPLLASQAWTNYVYFLIPSLIPYITRLPQLRGMGMDPRTKQPNGSDGLDGELYMWLNFITTCVELPRTSFDDHAHVVWCFDLYVFRCHFALLTKGLPDTSRLGCPTRAVRRAEWARW